MRKDEMKYLKKKESGNHLREMKDIAFE